MNIYFTTQFNVFELANPERSSFSGSFRHDGWVGYPSATGEYSYLTLHELLEEEADSHKLHVVSENGDIPVRILEEYKLDKKNLTVIRADKIKLQPGDLGIECHPQLGISESYAYPESLPLWAREQEAEFAYPKDRLQSQYDIELTPRGDAIQINDQTYVGVYSYMNNVPVKGTGKIDQYGYWDGEYETERWVGVIVFRKDQPIEVLFKIDSHKGYIEDISVEGYEVIFNCTEWGDQEDVLREMRLAIS